MARQIVTEIVADPKKFKSGVADVEKESGKLSSVFQGIGQGIGQAGFGLLDSAVGKITDFMGSSAQAASDLNETVSKVGVVFGSESSKVMSWAENSAKAMGMSKNSALSAAGTYGNLFVSMGMTTDKSADMSKGLVALAGDLASFNNLSPEEVLEKLRAGLTGETEPLKSLGVNINEATLKAKALEMGLWDGKGAIDASAKAQASYALILEQTKTAQGDFARTSDGVANQQRIMAATVEDAQAKIGNAFMQVQAAALPVLIDGLNAGSKAFDDVSKAVAPIITEYGPKVQQVFAAIGAFINDPVMPALRQVGSFIQSDVAPAFRQLGNFINNPVIPMLKQVAGFINNPVLPAFRAIAGFIGNNVVPVFQTMLGFLHELPNNIANAFNMLVSTIAGMPGRIAGAASGMFEGIWQSFRGAINAVIRGWNNLKFTAPKVDIPYLGTFGGFTVGTPNIPYLAAGGIVTSPTLAMIGERGPEAVVPLSRGNMGSTVNIYITEGAYIDGPAVDRLALILSERMRLVGIG